MTDFSTRLLTWFERHGRRNLPWQRDRSPYRVWVSEIMLQQTQVATVIPYFERFMRSFPSVTALAEADEDSVLHHWTGLGYYARARNLHLAARKIQQELGGIFPDSVEKLSELPGIGRSTAGAIVAQAFGRRAAILDGNVKRVLTRYHCIEGWPGQPKVQKALWDIAAACTPEDRCADYTQAIMDLGATLCTRGRPACPLCPLRDGCRARAEGRTAQLPHKKPRKDLPVRSTTMLMLQAADRRAVLLEKRPPQGVWGGLWSFPELADSTGPARFLRRHGFGAAGETEEWDGLRHTFSHFHLDIRPLRIELARIPSRMMENGRWHWYDLQRPPELGLAAPVKKLLALLRDQPMRDQLKDPNPSDA